MFASGSENWVEVYGDSMLERLIVKKARVRAIEVSLDLI